MMITIVRRGGQNVMIEIIISENDSNDRQPHTFLQLYLDLDIAALARGFALLHLPRMPELKGRKFPEFHAVEMDYSSIPYR